MQFLISFDLASLLFLLIILWNFFSHRQFPSLSNKIFGSVLILSFLNLLADIFGTISLRPGFPIPLSYVINTFCYLLQPAMSSLLCMYVLSLSGLRKREFFSYALIPAAVFELLILCTVPFGLVFQIDPVEGYLYGPLYFVTYLCAGFYLLSTLLLSVFLHNLTRRERFSMIVLIGIILITVLVQFIDSAYCVTGTGIAAALVIVDFMIQDPTRMIDSTIGVFNHASLLIYLRSQVFHKRNLVLLAVDLHGLKQVNALYGTHEGDRLLTSLCATLSQEKKCWVFRMGETRFVAASSRPDVIDHVIQRLPQWENRHWPEHGHARVHLTSCYIPEVDPSLDAEGIVTILETALLYGSRSDKPFTRLENRELKHYSRLSSIENALRLDIPQCRGFHLVFQPIRDLRTDSFRSAETLLRYESPEFGQVKPDEFVDIAERAGLAVQLDEMVIRLAFGAVSSGVFQGLGYENIHVNLSSASLAGDTIANKILALQQEYQVDPSFFILEITESAAASAARGALQTMEQLREKGFRFAMDDFGTGYSSLTRLLKFPFNYVKLDRSLLFSDPEFYRGLARIFTQMGMELVAEGVENLRQAEFVRDAGVRYIQGFYYAYPQTPEELRTNYAPTVE